LVLGGKEGVNEMIGVEWGERVDGSDNGGNEGVEGEK